MPDFTAEGKGFGLLDGLDELTGERFQLFIRKFLTSLQ
jgi:hypothetical protein